MNIPKEIEKYLQVFEVQPFNWTKKKVQPTNQPEKWNEATT